MSMVNDAIRVIREKEQDPILTFDCHLSSLRDMIKIMSRSISSGAEYDVSFEVACIIAATIQSIAEECPFTNPQTRFNGLSAMLKIGKNIALLSKDTLGHEVRMQFDSDPSLAEEMLEILNSMTEDEIQEIRGDESSPGSLWLKLQELEKLSDDLGIHPGLDEVLKQVDSDGCEDEEELDEEEDEDENEEELDEEENEDEEN
ncbi:hypothetical protein N7471_004430 [Penicillium samsonianum]|uniref:uncharacterized protein n=1 Tax=Penicillium samsonianum TaxID=1882272 RepID=UPI002546EE06|nr:uncharacterized protein N7471_004430 [Penicillium samsonianum]KAJ6137944.1 hypothetical protein N7471_004430 [Penicillium samsonianum]